MNTIQTTGVFYMNFKTGKLEAISTESALKVGQVVSYADMANPRSKFAVTGPCETYGQPCICEDGHISHVSMEDIERPGGWQLVKDAEGAPLVLSADKLVDFVRDAKAEGIRLAAERDQAKSDKAKKDAEERTRIIAKYPYLTQYDYSGKASRYAVGAKNMRKELERAFPGVTFSCRSKSYSGGCSIHASWTDGPTEAQASPIVDKYQECDFDGMDDSTSYRHSVWPEVFGGAKYTFASRHESPALTVKAALALGYELTEADFDQHGNLDETRAHLSYEICQMIYREARKTSGK